MKERGILAGLRGRALAIWLAMAVFSMPVLAGDNPPLRILATLFPQYDFARQIAGDRAEVRLLLPPGAESHSFEPTPSDMMEIAKADLFIYTGPHMEPWAARLADAGSLTGGVTVVDASRGAEYRREGNHDAAFPEGRKDHKESSHGHGHNHSHDHGHDHYHEFDPHIWLDPILSIRMIDTIAATMKERDPANAVFYAENARRLREELETMDEEFRNVVTASPGRTLVFGERFAFGYFFDRYGLEEIGPYASCAPGAEPGLKAVLDVIAFMNSHGARIIYQETTAAGRISTVLVEETGASILTVDSLHNPPVGYAADGYNYQSVMRANMAAFARGLQ